MSFLIRGQCVRSMVKGCCQNMFMDLFVASYLKCDAPEIAVHMYISVHSNLMYENTLHCNLFINNSFDSYCPEDVCFQLFLHQFIVD